MEKNLKNIRQEFKKAGVFYTPSFLAEKMKSELTEEPLAVYDPTCGAGNLLAVFPDHVKKYGVELDEKEVERAQKRLANAEILQGDTLSYEKSFGGQKFDAVIMNPPYSIKWVNTNHKNDPQFQGLPVLPPNGKADYAFLFHALHRVKQGGQVIALMHPGILYRAQREGRLRQYLCEKGYIEKIIAIPAKQFEDTPISTVLLVLRKTEREQASIEFQDGERKEVVNFEKLKEENFSLSPNLYLEEEQEEKPKVDFKNLEMVARANLKAHVIKSLSISRFFCRDGMCDPLEFNLFIDDLTQEIQAIKF